MVLNWFFDVFSFNISSNTRYWYIVALSLLSALVFLLIFKKTSNQEKIASHKKKIFGNILQMRLYKDQFDVLFLSIFGILKHNALYVSQTLIPLVFMILPLIIFTMQINNRCGYKPLQENQRFIIRIQLDENVIGDSSGDVLDNISCEASPEIELETLPLRIEENRSVLWRAKIVDSSPGSSPAIHIGIRGQEQVVGKPIVVHYHQNRFSPDKRKWSLWNELFNNGENFIPENSPIKLISTDYQRAGYGFLFWSFDAIIVYFIFTLIFVLVLKKFFHVTI